MKKIIIGSISIVILGIVWVLISPIWRNKKLDEPLPQPPVVEGNTSFTQHAPEIKDAIDTMDSKTKQDSTRQTEKMQDKAVVKAEPMPSNQPRVLGEAPMIARAHNVAGKALIVQIGDQKLLRFQDLKTINGPDLRIYLSTGLNVEDAIDLGTIRATEGNVNYTLPAGTDTTKYHNVLIWCRAFSVLFSYAQF